MDHNINIGDSSFPACDPLEFNSHSSTFYSTLFPSNIRWPMHFIIIIIVIFRIRKENKCIEIVSHGPDTRLTIKLT